MIAKKLPSIYDNMKFKMNSFQLAKLGLQCPLLLLACRAYTKLKVQFKQQIILNKKKNTMV